MNASDAGDDKSTEIYMVSRFTLQKGRENTLIMKCFLNLAASAAGFPVAIGFRIKPVSIPVTKKRILWYRRCTLMRAFCLSEFALALW